MHRIRLHYLSGSREGQVELYPVQRYTSLSLGRGEGCDVRFHPIDDARVSRNHAMLEWSKEDPPLFRLNDLLSSNGTFVNGRRIAQSVLLRDGDEIQLGLGGPTLRFVIDTVEDSVAFEDQPARPSKTIEIPSVTARNTLLPGSRRPK
jgi:pSer/pThr/pTyr-binding forkhead associated (FHA) protein